MDPQSLGITESIILRLDLGEHHLRGLRVPEKEIGDATAALLILLRHDLADGGQRGALEAPHDLDQVVQLEGPVDAHDTGLFTGLARVQVADDVLRLAVGDLDESMIDFGGARRIEGVRVEVERAGLKGRLKNVGDVGEENVVEEVSKL